MFNKRSLFYCRYRQCGCVNPQQWNSRLIYLPETEEMILAPLCNSSNTCYSDAGHIFLSSSLLMQEHCSYCPEQCSIIDFNIKNSLWKAPPIWLIDEIKQFVENSEIPLPQDWSINWRSHIDSSYLSVDLVHESTIIENFTQTATVTAIDVLSNVGGQTGLWIGVSFLSIMELAEMLFRLIQHQFRVVRRRYRRTYNKKKLAA